MSKYFFITDDPTWKTNTDCKVNGCLSFDGGDFVKTQYTQDVDSGPISISAWIKPNSGGSGTVAIFSQEAGSYYKVTSLRLNKDIFPRLLCRRLYHGRVVVYPR